MSIMEYYIVIKVFSEEVFKWENFMVQYDPITDSS